VHEDTTPGWLLREISTAGRENLDPEHVVRYDSKEPADAAAEVEYLTAFGLDASATVVDLGAGTGQFTLAVAPRCARVVAADVSPVMLEVLRAKVADAGLTNIEVVEAGFLTYVHRAPPADVVYSRYALHHLPDFWKALALQRIYDVLRPGGHFRLSDVVYNFDPADVPERVEAWCAAGGEDVTSEWLRGELEEHVRDEHSTYTWVLEPMAARVGLRVLEAGYSPDGFVAEYLFQRP
jgi:SAM-dependent methyltransferase